MIPPSVTEREIKRLRSMLAAKNEKKQQNLIPPETLWAETIKIKLDGLLDTNQFWNFCRCGEGQIFRTCKSCGSLKTFTYRCSLKWCPRCARLLAIKRKEVIGTWAKRLRQPKHLVLTQRNFQILTRKKIRQFTVALAKLRRRKVFRSVKGGCMSIEITNEGNGWHLHAHCLLEVRWLEMEALSIQWGKLVGQEFGIVKIKDVRQKDFLQEVTKYLVKGSELAGWSPDQLNEFVRAIRGLRFFFSFGELWNLGPEIRRELAAMRPPPPVCECGCGEFFYESEESAVLHEVRQASRRRA